MKPIKINSLDELDSAILARKAVELAETAIKLVTSARPVSRPLFAESTNEEVLGVDWGFGESISATFRPEIVPHHIREKMAADRAAFVRKVRVYKEPERIKVINAGTVSHNPVALRALVSLAREIKQNARK